MSDHLRVIKSAKYPKDFYFLRAESFYNLASNIDDLGSNPIDQTDNVDPFMSSYGGKSLHQQSHGESFISLMSERFTKQGLYFCDEPEAALSANRQMTMMVRMKHLVDEGGQFIIATHSPILLSYPGATIYEFSDNGIKHIEYKDTEPYKVTKMFLDNPQRMLRLLFD